MKLTALVLTLFVLITLPAVSLNKTSAQESAPKPMSDIERLEAEFKEIDAEAEDVTVNVSGDKESSGKISIKVKTTELSTQAVGVGDDKSGFKISTTKNLLIDLSKVSVPEEYIKRKLAEVFLKTEPTGQLPGVKVMQIGASDIYEVLEDYTYNSGKFSITVRKGFRYDRASIPRYFWVIIDKDSLSNVAPLFHDLLYRNGGVLPTDQVTPYRKFSRKDTDDLFLELMTKCGVASWRRELAYQAVRNFSAFAWKEQ